MKPFQGAVVFLVAALLVCLSKVFLPGTLLEATYTPTPIQSLQPFTATFAGGSATATATLTALRAVSNAIIVPNGLLSTTSGGFYTGSGFLRAVIMSTI